MSARKYLLIPQLLWYGLRAPRAQSAAWNRFWSSIERTGPDGQVLWDAASREELDGVLARVDAHMDRTLPLVDLGCGNGRYARALASRFPRVVGVDVSPSAVARAQEESRGTATVSFRTLDVAAPGAVRALAQELGEANVFMRGVFHVFDASQRATAVANLRELVGTRGVIYCAETNYTGDPLDQLVAQGATPTGMPDPLRRCIAAGIRPPSHFGEAQLREFFPASSWEVLEHGPVTMHGLPLTSGAGTFEVIPSFYALVCPRARRGNARAS